jgi:hypothetical protein
MAAARASACGCEPVDDAIACGGEQGGAADIYSPRMYADKVRVAGYRGVGAVADSGIESDSRTMKTTAPTAGSNLSAREKAGKGLAGPAHQ